MLDGRSTKKSRGCIFRNSKSVPEYDADVPEVKWLYPHEVRDVCRGCARSLFHRSCIDQLPTRSLYRRNMAPSLYKGEVACTLSSEASEQYCNTCSTRLLENVAESNLHRKTYSECYVHVFRSVKNPCTSATSPGVVASTEGGWTTLGSLEPLAF